jgi:Patatin-like phospholipase
VISHGRAEFLSHVAEVLKVGRAVRGPLLVAVAAGLFLSVPPQTREIYRALAEDLLGNVWQLGLSLVLLCAASIALALIARELLHEQTIPRTPRLTRKLMPILCAVLIPGGLTIGLYLASREAQIGTPPAEMLGKIPELNSLLQALQKSRINLLVGGLICTLTTASLLVPNFGFRSLSVRKFFARRRPRIGHFAGIGVGFLLFFSIFSVSGSQLFGPIGIFLLAIIGIASVAALLTRVGDRRRLPVLSGVVLIAVLLSIFDLTDNHGIELTSSNAVRLSRAVDVFEQWYESRADRQYYTSRGKPYPVFVVAASGGGLYAAHHAATVLSRLQDRCPNFSQHVFAISGVSGGSLGGALFSSLAKKNAQNREHVECLSGAPPDGGGHFEQQINRFMETDFLSPILGAALFPDAVQRFFPAVSSRFDRARAFESTLARAWTKLYPSETDNPWSRPFLDHWNTTGVAPALVLNSTNVEHGYRVAVTPFEVIDLGEATGTTVGEGGTKVGIFKFEEFHRLARLRTGDSSTDRLRDTTLATAVSLSARFPWVLPAGRMERQSGPARLVDGGYVENSGAETAFDLVQAMARFYDRDNLLKGNVPLIQIHVIAITNFQILQPRAAFGLGETLSPIRAMLSAREARAVVALSRMWRFVELCAVYVECGKRVQGSSFTLNLFDFDLPLGWLVAPSTRKMVELHSGMAHRAGTYLGGSNIDESEKFPRLGAYAANNDTAACEVVALLEVDNRRCGNGH